MEEGEKKKRKEKNDGVMLVFIILALSPLILGVWTIIDTIARDGKRHPGLTAFIVIGALLIILFWMLCFAGVIG